MSASEGVSYPAWIREIILAFPVTAQFVIGGNIRDIHFVPDALGTGIKTTLLKGRSTHATYRRLWTQLSTPRSANRPLRTTNSEATGRSEITDTPAQNRQRD